MQPAQELDEQWTHFKWVYPAEKLLEMRKSAMQTSIERSKEMLFQEQVRIALERLGKLTLASNWPAKRIPIRPKSSGLTMLISSNYAASTSPRFSTTASFSNSIIPFRFAPLYGRQDDNLIK